MNYAPPSLISLSLFWQSTVQWISREHQLWCELVIVFLKFLVELEMIYEAVYDVSIFRIHPMGEFVYLKKQNQLVGWLKLCYEKQCKCYLKPRYKHTYCDDPLPFFTQCYFPFKCSSTSSPYCWENILCWPFFRNNPLVIQIDNVNIIYSVVQNSQPVCSATCHAADTHLFCSVLLQFLFGKVKALIFHWEKSRALWLYLL